MQGGLTMRYEVHVISDVDMNGGKRGGLEIVVFRKVQTLGKIFNTA